MALFDHRAKTKERQYNKRGFFLEVVHRKPGYNVYYFSVGANCSVRCRQSRSTPTSGPPIVSARAPAHRSYHFRGVKLKSCIKKIHHNLYISKQANVRIKHADTEGASHKKFGTDARVQ